MTKKVISSVKRPMGLKKIHIAVLTKNDSTGVAYETPKFVKGVETFQYSTKYIEGEAFSDDMQDTAIKLAQSIDIDMTLAQYNHEIISLLQGHTTENGGVVVKTDDFQTEVAIIFESMNSDKTTSYYILYRCKLACEGMTLNTQGDNIDFAKVQLKGKALPTEQGYLFRIVNSDTSNLKEDFITNFYTKICLPADKVTND